MNDPAKDVFGIVDVCVVGSYLGGWVFDNSQPEYHEAPVFLQIRDKLVGEVKADFKRGDGYHGFRIPYSGYDLSSLLIDGKLTVYTFNRKQEQVKFLIHQPLLSKLKEEQDQYRSLTSRPSSEENLTTVLIPVGTQSLDGSAIFGRDGYIFLYRGSNDVASLQTKDPQSAEVVNTVESWLELFRRRAALTKERGIGYIQLVLPEKSTVLFSKAPAGLGPITPTFMQLDRAAEDLSTISISNDREFKYRSVVGILRTAEQAGSQPFLRTDSHLSTEGCRLTVRAMLGRIEEMRPELQPAIQDVIAQLNSLAKSNAKFVFSGDMSKRFFDVPVFEILQLEKFQSFLALDENEIPMTTVNKPADGEHGGTHIYWSNPAAPIKLKVVAFANSFFERGAASRGLSWWCKHLFSEFHFVWASDLQIDLLDKFHPDIVICQTIERFLHVVPAQ